MVHKSAKAVNYRIFKGDLVFEKYFDILEDKDYFLFCKFWTTNHRLPIKQGRWNNILRENRLCTFCDVKDVGDEYHHMMTCSFFLEYRKKFIYRKCYTRPNVLLFNELMSSYNKNQLVQICKFIRVIIKNMCPPG